MGTKSIGILVIATGRYIEFVPALWESIKKYFLPEHKKTMNIFTDMDPPSDTHKIITAPMKWPYPTLMRYHQFCLHQKQLLTFDYLYYFDADMLVVDTVGEEVLGDLVATVHPGYWNGQRGTYETRKESKAYVSEMEGKFYFAGGFNGGSSNSYLKMSNVIKTNVDIDEKNNIIAIWHDESHLNRYLINNPPSIILSPSYCHANHLCPQLPKKIIALDKNHDAYRNALQ